VNARSIGVSIPAYRNVEALGMCLESVMESAPRLRESIVVVDDSGEGSVARALRSSFPRVEWRVHRENRGFGPSANEAVLANPADLVILLNDDARLMADPCPVLLEAFRDQSLFSVSFRSLDGRGREREGCKRLVWRRGFPKVLHNPKDQLPPVRGIHDTAYAVGGHAAFDRSRFAELKGFDPLFEPFYWEDVDLGQRARIKDWRNIYLPACTVTHAGPGAIKSSTSIRGVRLITQRNRMLFAWRHMPAAQRLAYPLALLYRLSTSAISDRVFLEAFRQARIRWREHQAAGTSEPAVPIRCA
jgi:GT2 family glycosyltransferase